MKLYFLMQFSWKVFLTCHSLKQGGQSELFVPDRSFNETLVFFLHNNVVVLSVTCRYTHFTKVHNYRRSCTNTYITGPCSNSLYTVHFGEPIDLH